MAAELSRVEQDHPGGPACRACLRRSWLLATLTGRIEIARRQGTSRLRGLLALGDAALVHALQAQDPELSAAYRRFDAEAALAACTASGVEVVCRHHPPYPSALLELEDAPAALHVVGGLQRFAALTRPDVPATAIVGARRATPYGLEIAAGLGRGLGVAGVTVVSGMALGIDSAAHTGALQVAGPTIAVLAGGADRPYPPSKHRLYEEIRATGCVISELPPGAGARRWSFPARNRVIAGLAQLTVVVEAAERSGSLITAEFARDLGREVGAVPGSVTSSRSAGPNALLKDGAHVVRDASDALDLACGVGAWGRRPAREQVPGHLTPLLGAVSDGADTLDRIAADGVEVSEAMAGLAELELSGHVRRVPGGRYVATA